MSTGKRVPGELSGELEALRIELAELERSRIEHEQAKQAFQESEERYRSLFDGVPVGLYRTDVEGKFLEINAAMLEMLGFSARESLEAVKAPDLYVDPADRVRWQSLLAEYGTILDFETHFRRQDGTMIWVRDNARALRDSTGKITSYEGSIKDITGRKLAEQIAAEAIRVLEKQNQRLESLYLVGQIVNSTLDVEVILDHLMDEAMRITQASHGQVLLVNEANGCFERRSLRGFSEQEAKRAFAITLPLDRGINGRAYLTREMVLVDDVQRESNYFRLIPATRTELAVPIIHNGEVLGNLDVQSPVIGAFHDLDIDYLRALAEQVSIALSNARLYQQSQVEIAERKQMEVELHKHRHHLEELIMERTVELQQMNTRLQKEIGEREQAQITEHEQRVFAEALRDTAAAINSTLNLDEVLDKLLDYVKRVVPHEAANIMLVEKDLARVVGRRNYAQHPTGNADPPTHLPIDGLSSLRTMASTKQGLLIQNVDGYPGWFVSPQTQWIRSYMGVPICADGVVIGFLSLNSSTANYFTPIHAARLQAFVDQAAIAIENAQLHEVTKERTARLELIAGIGNRTTAILDMSEMLHQATLLISLMFGYYKANIFLIEGTRRENLVLRATSNLAQQELIGEFTLKVGSEGITGWVGQNGEPLLVSDTTKDLRYKSIPNDDLVQAELAVPIILQDEVIGVLDVESIEHGAFSNEDQFTLQTIADQIAIAIHNAHLYQQVQSHAADLESRVTARTAELQAANEHLRALSKVKDEFVSNVSHELRTPITNIQLYHDLMARLDNTYGEYLTALNRETDRLARIIEDLLRLSRLDQGQVTLKLEPFSLNTMAAQFVADRKALASSKGLVLEFAGEPDLPPVAGDEGLIGQVLSILLTNAFNYTPDGGKITVSTYAAVDDDQCWVGFAVADTGPGVVLDEQERLFERFFRGKVGRKTGTPGTGLGLAIVKDIVARHDGRVEVFSEGIPGKGARFTIWLKSS
jgi:PAS domain S-box-containing protein